MSRLVIYRFHYRKAGDAAVGFIDPASQKMVMLRPDGKFWSAYRLSDGQFNDIVRHGWLW
ncbi:hypothetical protein [Streptomyces sp. NPDC029003]|uniref:hypothetical protein n=1 Tax=Streptomyces sp. NPDC029003 TaxID=3155125 RepID=UPI0033D0B7E2